MRRLLDVRPHFDIQSVTYDWVHTLLQHGILNVEIQGLLTWCADLGITRETVQTFLKDETWVFPSATSKKQKQLHRIFDVHRVSKDKPDKIRCTCSELMGVYGMLRLTFGIRCSAHFSATIWSLSDLVAYRFSLDGSLSDLLACSHQRLQRLGRSPLQS